MPEVHDELEHFLAVGRVAVLQMEPQRKDGPRFPTGFVGWRKGRAVYIEHPRTTDGRQVAFRDGQQCVVRFIHEGQACAFTSEILDWNTGHVESQVRLRWPQHLERLVLRRFDRVPFIRTCRATLATGAMVTGQLTDISIGGFGVTMPAQASKGDTFSVNFALPDGSEISELRMIVRMTRPTPEGVFAGCEIEPGQDRIRNEISLFVTSELARARHNGANSGEDLARILLLDPDTVFCDKVIRLLARQNLHAISVQNIVDAMHNLRAIQLQAIAIRQDLIELPGNEVSRIIHLTRGLDQLPIVIYGGTQDPGASKSGAQRWLPDGNALVPDLAFELKRILQPANPASGPATESLA